MKYQLKPTFKIEDEKYWILSDEISSFSSDEIADILDDIENLFADKYLESSFSGAVTSIVKMKKETSTVWYGDKEIGSIPTQELYLMLGELRSDRIGNVS